MQKNILHILTDDKFTDYVIEQFSAPEMSSEFVLIPSNNSMGLVKHVDMCTIVFPNSIEFEKLLSSIDQYSGVVLHGMFWGGWQTPILKRVPSPVKVVWVFWGGELYARHDIRTHFLAPISNILYVLKGYKNGRNTSWEIPLELYQRIDYCITSIKEEYYFAQQFTHASFKHFWYSYYSIEDTIGETMLNSRCEGNNVWIGNSAALVNNHLDILRHLRKGGLLRLMKDKRVIMPLSYGEPWVRNMMKKVGHRIFGNRLLVLEQYIPRNEYNALMLSCSTMIIGYLEPAANGNIMTALWLGMRVYLSEKSMAYVYYKRIGCYVFSIEHDLNKHNPDCFTKLSDDELLQNRKALMQEYGKQRTNKAVRDLVKELTTDN